jgi:hypothetical protein
MVPKIEPNNLNEFLPLLVGSHSSVGWPKNGLSFSAVIEQGSAITFGIIHISIVQT